MEKRLFTLQEIADCCGFGSKTTPSRDLAEWSSKNPNVSFKVGDLIDIFKIFESDNGGAFSKKYAAIKSVATEAQLVAMVKEVERLELECVATKNECVATKKLLSATEAKCVATQKQVNELREKSGATANLSEELKTLKQHNDNLENINKELINEINAIKGAKNNENGNFRALQHRFDTLTERCNTLESDKEALQHIETLLQQDKEALQDRCNTLNEEVKSLQHRFNTLKESKEPLQHRCDTLIKDAEALQRRCDTLETEKDLLQRENLVLRSLDAKAMKDEINALQSRVLNNDLKGGNDNDLLTKFWRSKKVTNTVLVANILTTFLFSFIKIISLDKFQINGLGYIFYVLSVVTFCFAISLASVWYAYNQTQNRLKNNLVLIVFFAIEIATNAAFFGLPEIYKNGTMIECLMYSFLSLGIPVLTLAISSQKAVGAISLNVALSAFESLNLGIEKANEFKISLIEKIKQ